MRAGERNGEVRFSLRPEEKLDVFGLGKNNRKKNSHSAGEFFRLQCLKICIASTKLELQRLQNRRKGLNKQGEEGKKRVAPSSESTVQCSQYFKRAKLENADSSVVSRIRKKDDGNDSKLSSELRLGIFRSCALDKLKASNSKEAIHFNSGFDIVVTDQQDHNEVNNKKNEVSGKGNTENKLHELRLRALRSRALKKLKSSASKECSGDDMTQSHCLQLESSTPDTSLNSAHSSSENDNANSTMIRNITDNADENGNNNSNIGCDTEDTNNSECLCKEWDSNLESTKHDNGNKQFGNFEPIVDLTFDTSGDDASFTSSQGDAHREEVPDSAVSVSNASNYCFTEEDVTLASLRLRALRAAALRNKKSDSFQVANVKTSNLINLDSAISQSADVSSVEREHIEAETSVSTSRNGVYNKKGLLSTEASTLLYGKQELQKPKKISSCDKDSNKNELKYLQEREQCLQHKIEVQRIKNEIERTEFELSAQSSQLKKARNIHENLCRVEKKQFDMLMKLRKAKDQLLRQSAKADIYRIEMMTDVSAARLQQSLVDKVKKQDIFTTS